MHKSKHGIDFFYEVLNDLEVRLGGKRKLKNCTGFMSWPKRGIYFFFEEGETRDKKKKLRVVRVGTHALKRNAKSTLWERLRQHRGYVDLRGNHRGSIFRRHVGSAIINREKLEKQFPNWGVGQSALRHIRNQEASMEKKVSSYIGNMPFLWLSIDDPAGPKTERKYFEKNSIILLSNYERLNISTAIDPPSAEWLGFYCSNEKVRLSGLWNDKHVQEKIVDPSFLYRLEKKVSRM